MLAIRKCSVSDIESSSNFDDISKSYAEELVVDGGPPPLAKMEIYKQLEKSGCFQIFGAFWNDILIGLITVLVTVFPHYSTTMSLTESFFVFKQWRKTGAGLKLLKEAENYSRSKKSICLLVSAPTGGNLAEVLPHVGYVETNRVFFRSLKDV